MLALKVLAQKMLALKVLAQKMLAQRLLAWVWNLCLLSKHMALDKSPGAQRKQF